MQEKELIIITDDTPAERAGIELENMLEGAAQLPVLLLLSGGSSFNLLPYVSDDFLGPHVSIGMLDERFSTDETINNFAQFMNTSFYARAKEAGCSFIDTRVEEGESLRAHAKRFEDALRAWVGENPDGMTLVTMGIGSDGHTAGIMPFPKEELVFNSLFTMRDTWVVGYDAGNKNSYPLRSTVTTTFLHDIVSGALIYMVGQEKCALLDTLHMEKENIAAMPARISHYMRNARLITDCAL